MTAEQVTRAIDGHAARERITHGQIARRMGTSRATVSAYLRGDKSPTLGTLCRLAEAVGMRIEVSAEDDRQASAR